MEDKSAKKLSRNFKKILKCDKARIVKAGNIFYLIIGYKRSTKDDKDSIIINEKGKRMDYDYFVESIVARGKTEEELISSFNEYLRLKDMSREEYLNELLMIKD